MSHVADRFIVVLDANVLYPYRVRDVLLRFAEAGLYRARWSQEIIEEWTRNLLKRAPHLAESIQSQVVAMEDAFPEAIIEGYEPLVPSLNLPDPNDRHILAAAIRASAQHIVTENIKHFPESALKPYDIEAVRADTFLASTFELYQTESVAALRRMRREYKKPPMNPSEFLTDLMRVGLGQTALRAREHIDVL